MKHMIMALGAAAIAAAPAAAQDISARPHYGQTSLSGGFTPDPHFVQIQAGGNIAASTISSDCRGHITTAPSYNLTFRAGSLPLYISAESNVDTTIVVNAPDGSWYCNDDAFGLNPGLHFQSPRSGLYNIWVGTYSGSSGYQPATIYVSELGFGADASGGSGGGLGGGSLNPGLPANFGDGSLRAGFSPDPHTVSMVAGGDIDARMAVSGECRGYVTAAPDYELTYRAGSIFDLYISATSDRDTTLVVNGPDGQWYCNDDAFGLNPGLMFENPSSGVYDIWVGTYGGGTAPAALHISELGFGADARGGGGGGGGLSGGGTLDPSLTATFGEETIRAGFTPDPHTIPLIAGGDIDAREALSGEWGCVGYVAAAPDYELTYHAGNIFDLYISATSDRDTTLVVNGPDGRWHCNDDNDGLNPGLMFENPSSGVYDIWVGTYGTELAEAQLHISELGFGSVDNVHGDNIALDYELPANYGVVTLRAGFMPDPHRIELLAGGDISANDALDYPCVGYVTASPDVELVYTAGSNLDLYIYGQSDTDTTLVVNGPDGSWWCDDDGASGLNPGLHFPNPDSGVYDIWIGTYSAGAPQPATLNISEIGFDE